MLLYRNNCHHYLDYDNDWLQHDEVVEEFELSFQHLCSGMIVLFIVCVIFFAEEFASTYSALMREASVDEYYPVDDLKDNHHNKAAVDKK